MRVLTIAGAEELLRRRRTATLPDVTAIVAAVRDEGDAAVAAYARAFGDPPPRRIPADEIALAPSRIPTSLHRALLRAADRIERFARAQRDTLHAMEISQCGLTMGHRFVPIRRAGIYVPAGRHPLPSSLLMGALPAAVAGVSLRVVCTPRADPVMLAAARIAGIETVIEVGGAQAIAALAYGTRMIPDVDLIVGPGNAYVTAAKRMLAGVVGIDGLAGPSELMVVASDDADPNLVAADLLAQAEHDPQARVVLVTESLRFAERVDAAVCRHLETLETADTARAALRDNGVAVLCALEEAPDLCNAVAPEHLALHGAAAERLEDRCTTYGALFVGSAAAEVFGDYGAGPNHVLPTGGSARFASGLSVLTFLTLRTYQRAGDGPSRSLVEETEVLARAEGLMAHARAAHLRRPVRKRSRPGGTPIGTDPGRRRSSGRRGEARE